MPRDRGQAGVGDAQGDDALQPSSLLVVQPYLRGNKQTADLVVAVDTIGADVGERVLVVMDRASARHSIGQGPRRRLPVSPSSA